MKVTLLGSTGFVGKVLLSRLLDAGHEVKVLVRNPHRLGDMTARVTVLQGDFFSNEDIDAAIAGAEAVMSTIGPSKNEMSAAFAASCVTAMKHLVSAMEEQGPKRLIFMAGAAMPLPGETLSPRRRVMAGIIKIFAKAAWQGKVMEMQDAFNSGLDVTVVRPPMITESANGDFHVHETKLGGTAVGVSQVADFMVDQLLSQQWIGKAPVVWCQRAFFRH